MDNTHPSWFTIRVYGLIISESNEVLITDEFQLNTRMTKFPGGGMNFGEGTIDCLKREMLEECNQQIEDVKHFYTTDFYQKALFYENCQLVSIYYLAKLRGEIAFKVSEIPFDFEQMGNGNQSFRWVLCNNINPDEFTFPIDKHVALLLKEYFSGK